VPLPNSSCLGQNGWIEYVVGDLPIVISMPHGGAIAPPTIPDRTFGTMVTDRNTIALGRAIADALRGLTGRTPHLVISLLRRTKLDPNREAFEAAQGQAAMVQAWAEYHSFTRPVGTPPAPRASNSKHTSRACGIRRRAAARSGRPWPAPSEPSPSGTLA
jgi:hypothetical protein